MGVRELEQGLRIKFRGEIGRIGGFPGGSDGKESACNAGTWV